ncbi:MAG: 3'(2'),5'-bisphosphate nucleotidase CysQ [Brevundimonas sp.]|uniref:3'(2'),5'-bisphosphate nucleotidase CysQ n=1 Tax=Brevundimonas sp. TaxID=1871086 RepID=UPI001A1C5651|nr:3'(2'),5'-bisphosphate nucleotidase CysQ [Brevundimonas sp.]MBJ7446513.1 3'(2'),5'-bisphosphate nucleotidase CysQ [Brevundimonas sp.]
MIAAARPDLIADLASGALTEALADIAEDAARVILPYWRTGTVVTTKADDSPVTLADQQAEALILSRLAALYPDVQAVAEEAVADGGVPAITGDWFWLIDPLDGTRGFVAGKESFTVNIALVRGDAVVAGVVTAPATSTTWRSGPHPDGGAFRRRFGEGWQAIKVRDRPARPVAVMSHSLTDEEAQRLASRHGCMDWQGTDSSLKFCLIAEGRFDAYPRTGPTSEWDTAAGQAVLEAAGGRVMAEDGTPFRYGKPGFLNGGFVAVGS